MSEVEDTAEIPNMKYKTIFYSLSAMKEPTGKKYALGRVAMKALQKKFRCHDMSIPSHIRTAQKLFSLWHSMESKVDFEGTG